MPIDCARAVMTFRLATVPALRWVASVNGPSEPNEQASAWDAVVGFTLVNSDAPILALVSVPVNQAMQGIKECGSLDL